MSEFRINKVRRLHTQGDLSIHTGSNEETAFVLENFDGQRVLSIATKYDAVRDIDGIVNDRVVADAALHSIADTLWVIANDLAQCDPSNTSKMHELRSRARGAMITYAHDSKQGKAFSRIVIGER